MLLLVGYVIVFYNSYSFFMLRLILHNRITEILLNKTQLIEAVKSYVSLHRNLLALKLQFCMHCMYRLT